MPPAALQQASPRSPLAASPAAVNAAFWLPTVRPIAGSRLKRCAEPRATMAGRVSILKRSRNARRPTGCPAAIRRKAFARWNISLPGRYASEGRRRRSLDLHVINKTGRPGAARNHDLITRIDAAEIDV